MARACGLKGVKVGSVAELEEAEHPSGICHEWIESGWNLDGKWLENGLIKWKIDGTWLRQPCLQLFFCRDFCGRHAGFEDGH